jgi:hypothetical protein
VPSFQDKTEKWKYQTIIRETFMKAGKIKDLPAACATGKDFLAVAVQPDRAP